VIGGGASVPARSSSSPRPSSDLGALLGGKLANAIGRKRTMLERAGYDRVDAELDLIEADLRHEERGTFRGLFSAPFTKAGVFVLGFGFLVQITGINGIVY
jgi:hypothetical protein